MPSLQSQVIYFLLRHRHWLRLRWQPETWDDNTSIPGFRQECERQAAKMSRLPEEIEVEPVSVAGMYGEWLRPAQAPKDRAILYMIGGGYVSGSCQDHRAWVAKVAKRSGITVLLFNHRLAPEDPYPAALEDALAAYGWLLELGIASTGIILMGESAGGGLCLATLLALRDQGKPLPAAGVAISPWTDLKLTGESHRTKAKVCLSPKGMTAVCTRAYVGQHDPCLSWISPLYGDLHGLPPIYINTGEADTLLDDATRFADKARAAGVDVTLKVGEGMVHCYPLMAPLFPEATEALEEICGFIHERMGEVVFEPAK